MLDPGGYLGAQQPCARPDLDSTPASIEGDGVRDCFGDRVQERDLLRGIPLSGARVEEVRRIDVGMLAVVMDVPRCGGRTPRRVMPVLARGTARVVVTDRLVMSHAAILPR